MHVVQYYYSVLVFSAKYNNSTTTVTILIELAGTSNTWPSR